MNAVNSVQLFILVWTFTPVFQSDVDDISVSCEDVTGTVREEVTFTCSVTVKSSECCIERYKFLNPESDDSICTKELPKGSCEQRNSFTCRYTPTTAMTKQFRFFVQPKCGYKDAVFTVDITEPRNPEITTTAPPKNEPIKSDNPGPVSDKVYVPKPKKAEGLGFKVAVIAAVVSGFIIVIVPIIYKMKQKYKQKRRILENHHDVVQWSDITDWNTKALTFV